MSEHLADFLVDLACDPRLMAQFNEDPAGVLSGTALTDHERTLVLTRDQHRLADALGATDDSLGQGVEDVPPPPPPPPTKKAPAKKKKAPAKKKKTPKRKTPTRRTPKKPARKAPPRPKRKKR